MHLLSDPQNRVCDRFSFPRLNGPVSTTPGTIDAASWEAVCDQDKVGFIADSGRVHERAVQAFDREVNMAAIRWVWFAFLVVSTLLATRLWTTIIAELLKRRRRKGNAPASLVRQPASRPQRDASDRGAGHRWRPAVRVSKATSWRSGARHGHADGRLAPGEVLRSSRSGCVSHERRPNGPPAIHSGRRYRFRRRPATGAGRQCGSLFSNPRKP